MSGRSVVITGRGIVSPLGVGFEQHWSAVLKGEPLDGRSRLVAPPELLLPHLARFPKKQQKLYNRMTLLAMVAAALAMEDAALAPSDMDPTRFGVYLGVNLVGWELGLLLGFLEASESDAHPGELDLARANAYCMRAINPLDYSLKTLPNLTAGYLAIAHNAQGACRAYTDGPVGGLLAIADACQAIREGDLDVALAGGADAQTEDLVYASALGTGLVAREGEAGTGMVPAEGSALMVLEAEERARARGAAPRCRVLGWSSVVGGSRLAAETEGDVLAGRIERAMREGLATAGLARADLLALHADGTPALEAAERAALAALPAGSRPLATTAWKRFHGHLGAASPPAEALAASACLERGMVPGASVEPATALVNAVGFFGEVACLALGAGGGARAR